jgi:hypothetical protein
MATLLPLVAASEVRALSRDETGLLDRLAAAAIEDRDLRGMRRLDPAGIDEYGQMEVLQPGE